jgi:hypothetical protein
VGREVSHESLDLPDIPNLGYFNDARDIFGVCLDAAVGDDVPQELAPGDPEGALFWVQLDVEAPEVVEDFFQVGDEIAALSGLHDDVIDIDLQVAPYLPFEAELHTLLVCGPCILQPEGCDECGGGLIHLGKGYLVVA